MNPSWSRCKDVFMSRLPMLPIYFCRCYSTRHLQISSLTYVQRFPLFEKYIFFCAAELQERSENKGIIKEGSYKEGEFKEGGLKEGLNQSYKKFQRRQKGRRQVQKIIQEFAQHARIRSMTTRPMPHKHANSYALYLHFCFIHIENGTGSFGDL